MPPLVVSMNAIPVSALSNSPAWCVDFLSGDDTASRNVASGGLSGALVGDAAAVPVLEGVAVGSWSSPEQPPSSSANAATIDAVLISRTTPAARVRFPSTTGPLKFLTPSR